MKNIKHNKIIKIILNNFGIQKSKYYKATKYINNTKNIKNITNNVFQSVIKYMY